MYNDNNISSKRDNNRAFAGLVLMIIGGIYLLRQLNFFFIPSWLFSWPMVLILVGVLSGIKHNFRHPFAYVMIFLGGVFLLGHVLSVGIYYFWPIIMIAIGISMMFKQNGYWSRERWAKHCDHHYHHNNRVDL